MRVYRDDEKHIGANVQYVVEFWSQQPSGFMEIETQTFYARTKGAEEDVKKMLRNKPHFKLIRITVS